MKPADAPPNKYANYLPLDEVRELLSQYLAGNIEIGDTPALPTKKHKKKRKKRKAAKALPPIVLSASGTILASIAVIMRRIMRKYCKGQLPHPERITLWRESLIILADMVNKGKLQFGAEQELVVGSYVFNVVRFKVKYVCKGIVPLRPPRLSAVTNGLELDLNAKFFQGINKQTARLNIINYSPEVQSKPGLWNYVYILKCADGTLYTGRTNDLYGGFDSKYTKSRRPVTLVYWEAFVREQDAAKREDQIRRYTRKQKLKLVAGHRG
ncbi:hypothetical protein FACS1894217_00700 [Clostridia bacterium]|nr:hypothetical protein FACS1894217_00700 [Clostridia bacterium]